MRFPRRHPRRWRGNPDEHTRRLERAAQSDPAAASRLAAALRRQGLLSQPQDELVSASQRLGWPPVYVGGNRFEAETVTPGGVRIRAGHFEGDRRGEVLVRIQAPGREPVEGRASASELGQLAADPFWLFLSALRRMADLGRIPVWTDVYGPLEESLAEAGTTFGRLLRDVGIPGRGSPAFAARERLDRALRDRLLLAPVRSFDRQAHIPWPDTLTAYGFSDMSYGNDVAGRSSLRVRRPGSTEEGSELQWHGRWPDKDESDPDSYYVLEVWCHAIHPEDRENDGGPQFHLELRSYPDEDYEEIAEAENESGLNMLLLNLLGPPPGRRS